MLARCCNTRYKYRTTLARPFQKVTQKLLPKNLTTKVTFPSIFQSFVSRYFPIIIDDHLLLTLNLNSIFKPLSYVQGRHNNHIIYIVDLCWEFILMREKTGETREHLSQCVTLRLNKLSSGT